MGPKTALCLSGGGNRAILFHLGALRRLNELGVLSRVDCISSVSGGSVVAGVLAMNWSKLTRSGDVFTNFDQLVAGPLESFVSDDIRTAALITGRLDPRNWLDLIKSGYSATDLLAEEYDRRLFNGTMLQSLEPTPEFIFCATNVETGVCWRFSKKKCGDWVTGFVHDVRLPLSQAIAASSAFTLAFPPLHLRFDASEFEGGRPELMGEENVAGCRESVLLTDGGVYDNLGLEPVWKDFGTVYVSDGGMPLAIDTAVDDGIKGRLARAYDIASNQELGLRKRLLIARYATECGPKWPKLQGAYWGIGTDCDDYPTHQPSGFDKATVELLKKVRTDFNAFTEGERSILQNHGYVLANAAVLSYAATEPMKGVVFNWPAPGNHPSNKAENAAALARSHERKVLRFLTV